MNLITEQVTNNQAITSLDQVTLGQALVVVKMDMETSWLKKFLNLGLKVGSEICITNKSKSAFIAQAGTSRIAIAPQLASKILVQTNTN